MSRFFILFVYFVFLLTCNIRGFSQIDSTRLPLVLIQTNSPIVDEPKTTGSMKIIYNQDGYNRPDDTPNVYNGYIGIEIRGRYSAQLPQKPYGIETRDSLGQNLNIPLFHMPPENDWILLANYNDKSFMRNTLTFELFRQMGHYAPRTQFCEVIQNGYYRGIYVFCEKIKKDDHRVNIATLKPDDNYGDELTGGYMIKVDYYDEFDSWVSQYSPIGSNDKTVHFVYEYPDPEVITIQQKNYIQQYIHQLETALYTTSSGALYDVISDYIDIPSFVDYFIINELARNVDAYKKSSYFFKDKKSNGGLLHAGPVWDFDWAWKNIDECYFGASDGSGWAFQVHQCDPWPVPPSWMVRLLQNHRFVEQVTDRYQDLRRTTLSEDHIYAYIDSVALVLEEAQSRHYAIWPILGINVGAPEVDPQPDSYAGEVEKLKNWISRRLNWLDIQLSASLVTNLDDDQQNIQMQETPILIYPNPTSDLLMIDTGKQIDQLSIFTTDGKQVYTSPTNRQASNPTPCKLDVSMFPNGFYILKILFHDGESFSGHFIRND